MVKGCRSACGWDLASGQLGHLSAHGSVNMPHFCSMSLDLKASLLAHRRGKEEPLQLGEGGGECPFCSVMHLDLGTEPAFSWSPPLLQRKDALAGGENAAIQRAIAFGVERRKGRDFKCGNGPASGAMLSPWATASLQQGSGKSYITLFSLNWAHKAPLTLAHICWHKLRREWVSTRL